MEEEKMFLLQTSKHNNILVNIGILQEDGTYADDSGLVEDTFETKIYDYKHITFRELRVLLNS